MDMTLYRVGANGRVALGDLAADVEFYDVRAHTDENGASDGTLILTPIRVVSPSAKRGIDDSAPVSP